jgi:hypothetical protein
LADKDFRVKNKLHVNGLNNASGVILATNNALDSHTNLPTQYGGTGTTTSPNSGQILYSSSGTTYAPTTLNTLDVKGATYSADAPSSPVVGQIWVESDTSSDSFDPNIIRRKTFTATAAQTVFTTDLEFIQGYEQVFFNGMLLIRNSDYTTASNTNVTLAAGAAAGDIVEVVSITNLNSINAAGDQTIQGALNLTGNSTNKINAASKFTVDTSNTWGAISLARHSGQIDVLKIQGTDATGTANVLRLVNGSGNGSALDLYHDSLRFYVEGTTAERMRIDASGNVGIGYAAPNAKLEIRSTSAAVDGYGLVTIGSSNFGVDNGGSLSFAGVTSSDNNQSNFVPYAQISGRKENSTSGNYAGYLSFATRIHTGAITERMRIQSNGSISVQSGNIMYFQNPINTGSGSIYCAGGGSLTLASYNQPMITLHEDSEIRFFVGTGTQRAVINNAGELLIGYTSDNGNYKLQVNSQIFATSSSIATSDGRYKENVDTITSGLNIIDSLRPVSFTWKEHPKHNFVSGKTVGFIAQEVQESLSDYEWVDNIIKTNVSAPVLDEEGNEIYPEEEFLGIAEGNLIPLLVAAVKELKARVETLEAN